MIAGDSLSGVSVFVEAVEAGSFSAAAGRLNLNRSAVGKAVARLERRLGARLFHRTTRTHSLTEDGQAFYEHCLRALDEIRRGEAVIESGRRAVAGRLRVSMPVLFGRCCAAPVLLDLAARHPLLELELQFSDRTVDLVQEGFDLAVRNGPLATHEGLMTRRIALQRMTVCAAPAYLERRGAPTSPAELAGHAAVAYGENGRVRSWVFPQAGGEPVRVVPPARLRLNDLEAVADAATAGMGLSWLPCWLIRERVRRGELVRVLTDWPGLVFETYALWPATPHLPSRVRVAIDALAGALPPIME